MFATVNQWWANLDQAPKDLDKTIFRDLSPTPIPWVLEVLSTQAHFFGAALETVAENSRYVVDQWQHPTPNCYLEVAKCCCRLKHLFFGGIYVFHMRHPVWKWYSLRPWEMKGNPLDFKGAAFPRPPPSWACICKRLRNQGIDSEE